MAYARSGEWIVKRGIPGVLAIETNKSSCHREPEMVPLFYSAFGIRF